MFSQGSAYLTLEAMRELTRADLEEFNQNELFIISQSGQSDEVRFRVEQISFYFT